MIESLRGLFDTLFNLLGATLLAFHGWGAPWWLSIVMLTVVVRTLLFPLTMRQVKNMRRMQELKPDLDEIRARHKDEPKKQREEITKLYTERQINLLGGCLPLVVQLPIFIALYYTIKEFETLNSFTNGGLFWFRDLTAADPYFILPVAYVLTMMASQELTIRHTAPQQQRLMRILPVVFGFFLMDFPAGLFVYWISSNLITFAQNYVIYGRSSAEDDPSEANGLSEDPSPTDKPRGQVEHRLEPPRREPAQNANGNNMPSSGRRNRRKRKVRKKR
jgi:YidC/Oxa1 family membrane protein insertase